MEIGILLFVVNVVENFVSFIVGYSYAEKEKKKLVIEILATIYAYRFWYDTNTVTKTNIPYWEEKAAEKSEDMDKLVEKLRKIIGN